MLRGLRTLMRMEKTGGKRTNPYAVKRNSTRQGPTLPRNEMVQRVTTPPLSIPIPQDTPLFSELGKLNLLSPILLNTITEDLKFNHMMPVQSATLRDLLEKRIDCLVQAKTGTGKTIAFLLPAIQTLMNRGRRGNSGISLLVVSPTRELAQQIAKEATGLLQRLPQYSVRFAIGGTNKDREQRDILSRCDILIATPGRLLDHLSDQRIVNCFSDLDTLVLDEADRLLDMGFMPDLKKIVQHLPDKKTTKRQGMLFSATIAPHVEKVAHLILSDNYKFISTIPKGEVNTHERVPQLLLQVPSMNHVAPAMVSAIKSECSSTGKSEFKTILFAPTAALADWYGSILETFSKELPPVFVLHSRVSQNKRTSITNQFRESSSGVLVATDVVARGMDFPLVSHVFQVGVPADKESYIHRLGRTARAGREGRGVFIVAEDEMFFATHILKEINFLPFQTSAPVEDISGIVSAIDGKEKVYQAWMGYYKNHLRGLRWDTKQLVQEANAFALGALGCSEIPGIQRKTIGKMGLKGVPGLNIIPNEAGSLHRHGGGGEGRNGGSKSKPQPNGSNGDRGSGSGRNQSRRQ